MNKTCPDCKYCTSVSFEDSAWNGRRVIEFTRTILTCHFYPKPIDTDKTNFCSFLEEHENGK